MCTHDAHLLLPSPLPSLDPPLRTVIGAQCKDGVVIVVEKPLISKMLVAGTNGKLSSIDRHSGIAMTGLMPDGRQIINRAAYEAQQFKSFYGSPIPGKTLMDRLAGYVHVHTLYWHLRPFGVSFLQATYTEEEGATLYCCEPSGISNRYFGTAIGKGKMGAKTELEKLKLEEMTCEELSKQLVKIIHYIHDEVKDKEFEVEISWTGAVANGKHKTLSAEQVHGYEMWAKDQLEAEMDD